MDIGRLIEAVERAWRLFDLRLVPLVAKVGDRFPGIGLIALMLYHVFWEARVNS